MSWPSPFRSQRLRMMAAGMCCGAVSLSPSCGLLVLQGPLAKLLGLTRLTVSNPRCGGGLTD